MNENRLLSDKVRPLQGRAKIVPALPSVNLARDLQRFIRLGLILLVIGFGGFLAWAFLAPLDAGVPAQATAVVASKRKTIAHLDGGIVKMIHVVEAQHVQQGDPLITLDDTQIAADYRATLKDYYALLAMKARLEAERNDAPDITFPSTLEKPEKDLAEAAIQMENQRQLFVARRHALRNQIDFLQSQIETFAIQARSATARLNLLKEELAGIQDLAKEGYVPRNQKLDLERQVLEIDNQRRNAERQIVETRLKIEQVKKDYRKEVETQLADVVQKLAIAAERIHALEDKLRHTVIRAPISGYVNDLKIHTIGGVVRAGEPLMEIIPENEKLLFEAKVPSHLVDRVHAGLIADIQIGAFVSKPQIIIEGKLVSVSADLIIPTDPKIAPYYLARIEITEHGKQQLGNLRLQPGMPATVIIKTGEQSLMQYLLKPLLKRLHTALTEE